MKPWYAFNNPLTSTSFDASSNLRKSFVFWARSLRWTAESRWYVIISEAVVSRVGTRDVRSISASTLVRLPHHDMRGRRTPPCCDGLLELVLGLVDFHVGLFHLLGGLVRVPIRGHYRVNVRHVKSVLEYSQPGCSGDIITVRIVNAEV